MQWLSDLVSEVNKAHPELQVEIQEEEDELSFHFFGPALRVQGIATVIPWDKLDTARRFSWVNHVLSVVKPPKEVLDLLLLTSSDAFDDSVE